MRKLLVLPVAFVLASGFMACDSNPAGLTPSGPSFELVEIGDRVAEPNVRVFLSFALAFEEGAGGEILGPVAQPDGDALNFPGHEKNTGTCQGGTWINKNGKGMGGTSDRPHPHCTIYEEAGGETVYVVLEPISALFEVLGGPNRILRFTDSQGNEDRTVKILTNDGDLNGYGSITAWAMLRDDALGALAGQRVGHITINLEEQFTGAFDTMDCDEIDSGADGCLKLPVVFSYVPVGEADGGWGDTGVGIAGTYGADDGSSEFLPGFLWWEDNTNFFRTD